MKHLLLLLKHWTLALLAFLKPLGFWGVGGLALIDSGTIPLPIDFLLATYEWNDRRHAWAYVLVASAGSAIGGLIPFLLGRAGGEIFLLKRIDRARYEQLRNKFERQEFLAMMIPSMLPPPMPWKILVFAAGVFEMRWATFLLSVFAGRLVRFGTGAVLTVLYGPKVLGEIGVLFSQHTELVLSLLGMLIVLVVLLVLRRNQEKRREQMLENR